MAVKAGYVIIAGTGVILAWSGLNGKNLSSVIRDVINGHAPGTATSANTITPFDNGSSGISTPGSVVSGALPASGTASVAAYKAYAVTLLAAHGWPTQWGNFNNIVMRESGWNANARNNSSGAYGIGQALGHGTATTAAANGENNYGNFGTPDIVCKAANGGNGFAQLQWMCNYISQKYGSPNGAWNAELTTGAY